MRRGTLEGREGCGRATSSGLARERRRGAERGRRDPELQPNCRREDPVCPAPAWVLARIQRNYKQADLRSLSSGPENSKEHMVSLLIWSHRSFRKGWGQNGSDRGSPTHRMRRGRASGAGEEPEARGEEEEPRWHRAEIPDEETSPPVGCWATWELSHVIRSPRGPSGACAGTTRPGQLCSRKGAESRSFCPRGQHDEGSQTQPLPGPKSSCKGTKQARRRILAFRRYQLYFKFCSDI